MNRRNLLCAFSGLLILLLVGGCILSEAEKAAKNPFPGAETSVKSILADHARYKGKTVIAGPLMIVTHGVFKELENKIWHVYEVNIDQGQLHSNPMANIFISYNNVKKANVAPMELKNGDIVFVRGSVLVDVRGQVYIDVQELVWTGRKDGT